MAKAPAGAIRQRAKLAMGEKVNVGGGKPARYASGGQVDPRYQTLEQKRNTSRAKEFIKGAAGEDESGDTILSRAAKAIKRAVGADEGMKRGGKVHSDAAQDKKLIRQEIAKAKGKPGMNCGGRTKRK